MSRVVSIVSEAFAILGAALEAAAAVRIGAKPSPAALRQLGIVTADFPKLRA